MPARVSTRGTPYDGDDDGVAICDVGAYEAWPVHFFDNAIYLALLVRH